MKNLRITPLHTCLAWLVAALTPLAPAAAEKDGESRNEIVREGIAIELEMESLDQRSTFREGDAVTFRFNIRDTATGTPLSGVFPAAWMDRRPEGEATDVEACKAKVEAFIGGSLFSPPELDLNVYYVLALNNDASISVVDPLFGFGSTKLLDMIFLEDRGEDWALSSDQMTLYVSIPKTGKVAVATTATWEVTDYLSVGVEPSRIALQGDGKYLWVGYDGPRDGLSGVTVIDTAGPTVVTSIPTGRGHHEIAFSDDDRYAYVTNSGEGTVTVIDVGQLKAIKSLPAGREPISIAYSSKAGAVYVTSQAEGQITVVDGTSHEVVAESRTAPGLGQIKFAPGGQLGFAVNPETDEIHILDAALGRVVQTGDVEEGPDQVAFTDHLAYVRHRGSEIVLMIPLDQVGREGAPIPVIDFPGGQTPFGQGAQSPADGIVQAPGSTAVLVANPSDKAIYFYKEGMAAPMGQFQNYGRQPRAVLAVDRSLEERSPGAYETTAALRRPGTYDVAFFLDSPRTFHCFEVEVEPNPQIEAERVAASPVAMEPVTGGELRAGEKVAWQFRLLDAATSEPRRGVDDVRILTFSGPGHEQKRQWARPVGDGVYQIDFEPAQAGVYFVFVQSPSLGLSYSQSSYLTLEVTDRPAKAAADTAS